MADFPLQGQRTGLHRPVSLGIRVQFQVNLFSSLSTVLSYLELIIHRAISSTLFKYLEPSERGASIPSAGYFFSLGLFTGGSGIGVQCRELAAQSRGTVQLRADSQCYREVRSVPQGKTDHDK